MVLSSLSTETFEAHPTLGPRGVEELACGNQMGTNTYVGTKAVTEFSEQLSAASLDDAQRRARPLTSEEQERVHKNALAASDAEVHRIERGDGGADPLVVQLKIARETLATVQTQRDEHERLRVRAESERARVESERDEEVRKSLRVLEELESVKMAIAAAEDSRGRKQRRTTDAESVEPVTLENAAIVSSSELEALERRVADANSLAMRREEEAELLNKKLKKAADDERKKNKVTNAALNQKDAQIKQLKERREADAKAAKAAATEAREAREADARQAATHKEALDARLLDKDRVISQLGENLHNKDIALATLRSEATQRAIELEDAKADLAKQSQTFLVRTEELVRKTEEARRQAEKAARPPPPPPPPPPPRPAVAECAVQTEPFVDPRMEAADALIAELRAQLDPPAEHEPAAKSPAPSEPSEPRSPAEPTGTTSPALQPPTRPMQPMRPQQPAPERFYTDPTGVQIELAIMTAQASLQQLCDWTHHLGALSYAMPMPQQPQQPQQPQLQQPQQPQLQQPHPHPHPHANNVHVPWNQEQVIQQMQPQFGKGERGFGGKGRGFGKGRG